MSEAACENAFDGSRYAHLAQVPAAAKLRGFSLDRSAIPWTAAEFKAGIDKNLVQTKGLLIAAGIITPLGSRLSYEKLSEQLLLGYSAVTDMFGGATQLTLLRAAQLARILKVDLATIVLPDFLRAERNTLQQAVDWDAVAWTPTQFVEGVDQNIRVVRQELRRRRISIPRMADALGMRARAFAAILKGTRRLDLYHAVLMSTLLGVDPMNLMIPGFLQPGRLKEALIASRPVGLGPGWRQTEFEY